MMKNNDIEKKLKKIKSPSKETKNKVWDKVEEELSFNSELESVTLQGDTISIKNNKKRNLAISFTGIFVALVIFFLCLIPLFNKKSSIDYSGSLYIDINPSVQIELDKKGNVTEIIPLNTDGIILLKGIRKEDILGKSGEEASIKVWEVAVDLGYIKTSTKDNAMLITSSLKKDGVSKKFTKKVQDTLTDKIKEKGVYCVVLQGNGKKANESKAKELGISASKYELILSAKKMGVTILESEYKSISVTEINNRVKEIGKKIEVYGDYYEELENFEDVIEDMTENLIESIEDAVEKIELYVEIIGGNELIENQLDILNEVLEDIEDGIEEGEDVQGIFLSLDGILNNLSAYDEITIQIQALSRIVKGVKLELDMLNENIEREREELKQKYEQFLTDTKVVLDNFEKPNGFDEDYEEWIESVYDDYLDNWESYKHNYNSRN